MAETNQDRPVAAGFGSRGARRALAGFFLTGILLAFLGAILPSWNYHITSQYETIGAYFLVCSAGILGSVWLEHRLLPTRGIGWVLTLGCGLACAAFLYLGAVSPPQPAWARMIGVLFIGLAAGLIHSAVFHAISPMYRHNPASTVNLAGILFGLGCLTVTLLVSGTFYVYTVSSTLTLLAVIPGMFAIAYRRSTFAQAPGTAHRRAEVPPGPPTIQAVLFAFLVFFQFGNEWSLAGWLPVFLSQRLGISPVRSLLLLALYWFALLAGRIVAQAILPYVSHARLLLVSVIAAILGCLILTSTNNGFGAVSSVLLIGFGYAPIYPLVVERIGDHFPSYHPGFYNGIFSFAFTGGLLAPCTLGWLAQMSDIRAVLTVPLMGTVMVLVLLIAIWILSLAPHHGNDNDAAPAGPS